MGNVSTGFRVQGLTGKCVYRFQCSAVDGEANGMEHDMETGGVVEIHGV